MSGCVILITICKSVLRKENDFFFVQVCEYTHMLKLPHLPDMIFPNNSVVITYPDEPELRISFNAFDALKSVDVTSYPDVEVK